jgi:hypothetical protein
MDAILRFQPTIGIMTGFAHHLSHDELYSIAVQYHRTGNLRLPEDLPSRIISLDNVSDSGNSDVISIGDWDAIRGKVTCLLPAYDGLKIKLHPSVELCD